MTRTLFTNGQVFDGVRYLGRADVLVDADRVVAVGDPDDVRDEAGAGVEEVDLAGGLLTPGFLDGHMHPLVGGLERNRCEMTDLSSVEEYLEAIRKHHAGQPAGGWFRGGGWAVTAFGPGGPTAELLDRVVPDRPAFLPSSDHHDAWVNTKALEIAGITKDTPDPSDGWFERDAEGNPTGTIREGAMAMVGDHLSTTREEYRDAMLEAQRYLATWGVTGWHDALIGGYAGLDDPTQSYLDLIASGELVARVRASQWWDRHRGPEQVEDLVAERDRLAAVGLRADSVKVMVDGITETFTAAVTEPYLDLVGCRCGDRGMAFLDPEPIREALVALDAAGFAAHFHAIGDRAVHYALDAVAAARRTNGMRRTRHQVAHLQLVRPEDRRRFRALGATANLEGAWAQRARRREGRCSHTWTRNGSAGTTRSATSLRPVPDGRRFGLAGEPAGPGHCRARPGEPLALRAGGRAQGRAAARPGALPRTGAGRLHQRHRAGERLDRRRQHPGRDPC